MSVGSAIEGKSSLRFQLLILGLKRVSGFELKYSPAPDVITINKHYVHCMTSSQQTSQYGSPTQAPLTRLLLDHPG